jgi:tryptophan synthase alpha chain
VKGAQRIERALRLANDAGRLGFIPYITAGDPDLEGTRRLAAALKEVGADVLELGVPWSDPLADGPVNQRSAERALSAGTNLDGILTALPIIKRTADLPVVLFTYFNPILRYGLERFATAAASAGVDGVLVIDLPPEEARLHRAALKSNGIASIFLAAPTSTRERLKVIARASTGFVYAVARTGVTGAPTEVGGETAKLVDRIREHTRLPVAVGFGISRPEQVRSLRDTADAFVVGSALVEIIARHGASDEAVEAVAALGRTLVDAGARAGR